MGGVASPIIPGDARYDGVSAKANRATRLGGLMVVPSMLGAMFLVHLAGGFQWSLAPSETHPAGGNEFVSVLLALGLFFLFRGNAIMGPHTHVRRDAVERRESTPPPAPTPPTAPTPRA